MNDSLYLDQLRARANAGEALQYVFFWGHQRNQGGLTPSCFSQWYPAPFVVDGRTYPTAEHFMMAEKAALFGDMDVRAQVLAASTPAEVKALGRKVKGFDNALWLTQRFDIVVRANTAKFAHNAQLGEYLRQTGTRVLVEASPVDKIWGIGLAQGDERANNPALWQGLNLLGFALMQVRDAAQAA